MIFIIWLAFGIRLHDLAAVPLRGDEAFSALYWSALPLAESLRDIASIEPHPPLTYALFRFWAIFAGGIESPFVLRLLPVLGNLIGLAAVYALARRLSGAVLPSLLAALIWALHPYEIWHSQDYRNYAIWAGFSATALWLGLRLIERRRPLDWLLYALAAFATALFFYAEVFALLGFSLFVLLQARGNRRFTVAFALLAAAILAAVALAFLALQGGLLAAGGYGGNLGMLDLRAYLTRFIPVLLLGETLPRLDLLWLPLLAGCVALGFVLRDSRRQWTFVMSVALVPLILLGLASTRFGIFDPRYALAATPGFILLLALGCWRLARKLERDWLALLCLLPWLALALFSLHAMFNDPAQKKAPAWDKLGDFLNRWVEADDLVIQLSADAAFGYYYRGAAEDIALPENPRQSANEIHASLDDLRGKYASLWVVANANPSWKNAAAVADWMRDNMQLVIRGDAQGLGIRRYMDAAVDSSAGPALARFGDTVELMDYRLFDEPLPTDEIPLWLVWRPVARSDSPLKSFAHVYASSGALVAQHDQFPGAGSLDSRYWMPGVVFREVYYLSAESLETGRYEIRVGFYAADSGERLPHSNGDSFILVALNIAD